MVGVGVEVEEAEMDAMIDLELLLRALVVRLVPEEVGRADPEVRVGAAVVL